MLLGICFVPWSNSQWLKITVGPLLIILFHGNACSWLIMLENRLRIRQILEILVEGRGRVFVRTHVRKFSALLIKTFRTCALLLSFKSKHYQDQRNAYSYLCRRKFKEIQRLLPSKLPITSFTVILLMSIQFQEIFHVIDGRGSSPF